MNTQLSQEMLLLQDLLSIGAIIAFIYFIFKAYGEIEKLWSVFLDLQILLNNFEQKQGFTLDYRLGELVVKTGENGQLQMPVF